MKKHHKFQAIIVGFGLLFAVQAAKADSIATAFDKKSVTLIFNFDAPQDYGVRMAGGSLIVRFGNPIAADVTKIPSGLPGVVSEAVLSGDRKTLVVGLKRPMQMELDPKGLTLNLVLKPQAPDEAVAVQPEMTGTLVKPPPPKPEVEKKKLQLRFGKADNYTRIVFDWPKKPGYKIEQSSESVTVHFNVPGEIDSNALAQIANDVIGSVDIVKSNDQGISFKIDLLSPQKVRHFARGNSVMIDLISSQKKKEQKNETKKESAPQPEAKEAAAPVEPAAKSEPAPKPADSVKEGQFALPRSELGASVPGEAEAPPPAKVEPPKPVEQIKPLAEPTSLEAPQEVSLEITRGENAVTLKFTWFSSPAMAVFKRAGYVWIVFDRPANIQMGTESQSVAKILGGITPYPAVAATILRLPAVPGLEPSVWGEAGIWQIDFKPQKLRPSVAIPVDFRALTGKAASVFLTVNRPGRIIPILDPEVGDTFYSVPVSILGRGINGNRDYAEFSLLPTAQGVVIIPKSDNVKVEKEPDGVLIQTEQGLNISVPKKKGQEAKAAQQDGEFGPAYDPKVMKQSMLHYAEWRGDPKKDFFAKERDLLLEIGGIEAKDRTPKRLELARLYFANAWMIEAISVLDVIANEDETTAKSPEFLALRGVASTMERRFKRAIDDLKDQRFDDQNDIAGWRAVLAVQQNDWSAADQYFAQSDQLNTEQPASMRKFVGVSLVESMIENKRYEQAEKTLAQLEGDKELANLRDTLLYWRGEIEMRQDKPEEAVKMWKKIAAAEDPYARPRAEFALIKYDIEKGEVSREDIMARLERLRFAWRGDKFEYEVLKMLGSMQIDNALYRDGLYTLRRAVSNYADQPTVSELTDKMSQTFNKLFLEGEADHMPATTALALFDEFRELTPTGPDGDVIIQKLTDRLVSVDLLPRAEDLLKHQVDYRLTGVEKGRIAARLAVIYLLDRKPEDALKVLDLSNVPNMPEALATERRLLRARAFFDTNKTQEALDLIVSDGSMEADMLRADVYWRLRNWRLAARTFGRLIRAEEQKAADAAESADKADKKEGDGKAPAAPQPAPEAAKPDPKLNQWILSMAVATALAGDQESLATIRTQYMSRFKGLPTEDAFDIVTNTENDRVFTMADLTGKLAQVSRIESFMSNYREKIKSGGLSTIN